MMKVIIPAAGLATRFLPASRAIPKELFPVYDRPVIQYVIEALFDAGIRDMIAITRWGKEGIQDHFDRNPFIPADDPRMDQDLERLIRSIKLTSIRQRIQLGLGSAIAVASELINTEFFGVALPDDLIYHREGISFFKEMLSVHNRYNCSVIALMRVPLDQRKRYGIVEGDMIEPGLIEINRLIEKPHNGETDSDLAIVGRYILHREIMTLLTTQQSGHQNEIQLTDAIDRLQQTQRVIGLILPEDYLRFDAGDRTGFALANFYMAMRKDPVFQKHFQQYI